MIEMRKLYTLDRVGKIHFVDIHSAQFDTHFPQFNKSALDAKIHGLLEDGSLVTGLDVTYHAWQRVGKGWVYRPLRWPVIKWFADLGYLWFAKNRHRLSRLLTCKTRCDTCESLSLDGVKEKQQLHPTHLDEKARVDR
jgi:predicted DCC family thiol-disulfide oxidoreductase YuxK